MKGMPPQVGPEGIGFIPMPGWSHSVFLVVNDVHRKPRNLEIQPLTCYLMAGRALHSQMPNIMADAMPAPMENLMPDAGSLSKRSKS